MKKELIITDLMECRSRDSSGLSFIKKGVRKFWHKSLPRNMLRHVSRQGIRFALYYTDLTSKRILKNGYWESE